MKNIILIFLSINFILDIHGQTCDQEKIEIKYSNGIEVFNVCSNNPNITFEENREYFWYTEYSKIKSTKGGCGGKLLNGNYKYYDIYGNLRTEYNFSMGLKDGKYFEWDSTGNIVNKKIYELGNIVYDKFMDDNYWIEIIGVIMNEGTVKKVFSKFGNQLIGEEIILSNNKRQVKVYYESPSNQIKLEYIGAQLFYFHGVYEYSGLLDLQNLCGKYISYYKNGNIEVEGQYYDDTRTKIRIGIWKWYNQNGTLDSKEQYKAEIQKWPNGKVKVAGGLILDPENDEWIRIGEWQRYDENGNLDEIKEFNWEDSVKEK